MPYEEMIEEIAACDDVNEQTLDAAADAMSFIQALWTNFVEKGYVEDGEPDLNKIEGIIDGVEGELVAAALFLSEKAFDKVPLMLMKISASLAAAQDENVPKQVIRGYQRLAERIEKTKVTVAVAQKVNEQAEIS